MAVVNDAVNPDSSKLEGRKKGKEATCFSSRLARSTHTSHRATLLIHTALLQGCCLSAGCQPPRSLSLLPRAALVSFLGRGDD